jgi:hypothetical protein
MLKHWPQTSQSPFAIASPNLGVATTLEIHTLQIFGKVLTQKIKNPLSKL